MDEITLALVKQEIEELHQFFQDWFTAALIDTNANFARMDALGADFRMVVPSGQMVERGPLMHGLRVAHGKQPEIRIEVENVALHLAQNGFALATYDELQRVGEESTVRRSSVLFAADPSAPNGLSWLHVHETWVE